MLRVFGRRSAFNVQKVMWLVGELGLDHEHVDKGGSFGGLDDPEFLALNPHGRVPVVVDRGEALWESHTILRYLASEYGGERLWPDSPMERSRADRWLDWTLATLQPAFMELFWGYYRTPEPQRSPQRIARSARQCAALYGLLDRHLSHSPSRAPFLSGPVFTLADIPAGATLYRYLELAVELPELPHVRAWYARLAERPAYRDHVMIPFGELRGRLEF